MKKNKQPSDESAAAAAAAAAINNLWQSQIHAKKLRNGLGEMQSPNTVWVNTNKLLS